MKAQKYLLTGLIPLTLVLSSFSGEASNESNHSETIQKENNIQIVEKSVDVNWTAYKTTDKLPVKGVFSDTKIETQFNKGTSPEEILNDATFKIDVSNLSTGNADRDVKLKTLFFGIMEDSGNISGQLSYSNNEWSVNLTMNGVTIKVPVNTTFENNEFHLKSNIKIGEFNALTMLDNLNKACFELHKGADGISKTWEEVDVEATISFKPQA